MRVEKGRQVFPCTETFHHLLRAAQCSVLCRYPFTNLLSGSTALTNAHETGADLLDIWVNFAGIIGIIGKYWDYWDYWNYAPAQFLPHSTRPHAGQLTFKQSTLSWNALKWAIATASSL